MRQFLKPFFTTCDVKSYPLFTLIEIAIILSSICRSFKDRHTCSILFFYEEHHVIDQVQFLQCQLPIALPISPVLRQQLTGESQTVGDNSTATIVTGDDIIGGNCRAHSTVGNILCCICCGSKNDTEVNEMRSVYQYLEDKGVSPPTMSSHSTN